MTYRAILFDKDGTLTDFRATWETWSVALVHELSADSDTPAPVLGAALGIDVQSARLQADGLIVTAPFTRTVAAMAHATGWDHARLRRWLARRPQPEQVIVGQPDRLLGGLRARGLRLGVLTNDTRRNAAASLARMGAAPHLDHVIAVDDGHGPKPAPDGARAFAAALGLAVEQILLVGDGPPDHAAANAAGMDFVGVLTGTLGADGFPGARAVLADVTHLPGWLDGLS